MNVFGLKGVQQPSPRLANDCFTATPRRFFCDIGMISASKKSPKANVMYRAITSKADSVCGICIIFVIRTFWRFRK